MPAFNNLGHVALKVRDLEASVAFYEKLGFPEFLRLLEDDGSTWIVYMRFDDNLYLELFPGGKDRVPGPEGTGVNHLSLAVDDLDVTAAHLEKVGIPLSQPRSNKRGVDNNRGMWIEDPDGNRIEIMEMSPDCIQWAAIRDLNAGKAKHALVRPRNPKPAAKAG